MWFNAQKCDFQALSVWFLRFSSEPNFHRNRACFRKTTGTPGCTLNLICTEPWSHNCIKLFLKQKRWNTLVLFSHKNQSNSIYQLTIKASLKYYISVTVLFCYQPGGIFSNFLFDLTYGWYDEFDFFLQCNLYTFFLFRVLKKIFFRFRVSLRAAVPSSSVSRLSLSVSYILASIKRCWATHAKMIWLGGIWSAGGISQRENGECNHPTNKKGEINRTIKGTPT